MDRSAWGGKERRVTEFSDFAWLAAFDDIPEGAQGDERWQIEVPVDWLVDAPAS
jgi:hypothetical protein